MLKKMTTAFTIFGLAQTSLGISRYCFFLFQCSLPMLHRGKNKLKRGVRINLGLTKSRYDILKRANNLVKEIPSIKFCYADINFRLKVKFNDENQKYIFFSSIDNLRDIVDMEITALFINLSISVFFVFVLFCFLSLGMWQNFFNEVIKYRGIFKSNSKFTTHNSTEVFLTLSDIEDLVFHRCKIKWLVMHICSETIGDSCEWIRNLVKMQVIWPATSLETKSFAGSTYLLSLTFYVDSL